MKSYARDKKSNQRVIERIPRFLKIFWRQNKPAPRKAIKAQPSQTTCQEVGELYLSISEYEAELKSARKRLSTLTRDEGRGR